MQKFKSKKEAQREFDLIKRIESSAPNLTPVEYFEGPDYVCCAEKLEKPKPEICEGIPKFPAPVRQFHCLAKTKPVLKPCTWSPELNERDIIFRPIRWRCNAPSKQKRQTCEPSLGAPIGLSISSFGMQYLEGNSKEQSLQGFATNLVAFAEYFITPEIEWDEKVLNRILFEGQRLLADSKTRLTQEEKLKEQSIRKTFVLCGNTFDLLVNDPFMMGQVIAQEAAVPNLHWSLLKFFKQFQFCLLQIENWYTLLWKNYDVYFLFDCYGRRYLDLQRDRKHGVAILICLRNIENITHLILNLSGISSEDFFIIRNMQIKSLVPCGGQPTPDIVDRSFEFEIINENYAILRATIHLGSMCFKEIRMLHSLPVALCALINAKIDTTPTWDRSVLDKILKLGAHFFKQWTQCDVSIELGIADVPSRFVFRQFSVQITVNAMSEYGIWKCTPKYQNSDLSKCLKRAFEIGSNLMVQIQDRTYAIWKKGDFFYVLDPYSHQHSLDKKKIVTASLRMCGSFEMMCCIFTQTLLELFEESNFLIYIVKILELKELDKLGENEYRADIPCTCTASPELDDDFEVMSLNDSVTGVDGYACPPEVTPEDTNSVDLDSPGLSQIRLGDYTDMRRDFIEETEEETEDDEDEEDVDLDSEIDRAPSQKSDESNDDEDALRQVAKEKKEKKKTKKASKEKADKNRKQKAVSDLSDAETKKSSKKSKDDTQNKEHDKKTLLGPKEKENKSHNPDNLEDKNKTEVDKPDEKANEVKSTKPTEEIANNQVSEDTQPVEQGSLHDPRRSKGSELPLNRTSTDTPNINQTPPKRQPHQRRKQKYGDDSSSSADEIIRPGLPTACKPNNYPGFTEDPLNLAVVGSESGSYESFCNLFKAAFRCADRILTMTPWGNYVAFRSNGTYFIFDGCTCNLRSIRHMDLTVGTAGLLCFPDLHSLIKYIESGKGVRKPTTYSKRDIVDQICSKYCSR